MEILWINSILSLLVLFQGVIANKSHYIGCYVDPNPDRRLFNKHNEVIEKSSPNACIKLCKAKNFAYAGIQYGIECFCGNEMPSFKARADETECSTDCPGEPESKCGAGWRTSAYKTGLTALPKKENLSYIGCFADYGSAEKRLFDKYQAEFNEGQTPHYCVGLCYGLGYRYAALQYNFQCFCGDNHPPAQRMEKEEECGLLCTGDPSQKCGGHWKLSVYSTSITDIPNLGRYIGCYIDNTEDTRVLNALNRDFRTTNTPQLCVNFCLSNNFNYAGLQYGIECYCGNDEIVAESVPDDQCELACPGDDTRTCGGHWRSALYQLEFKSTYKEAKYLGCFKDQSNDTRLFQGYKQNLYSSLTVQRCIEICRGKGFHYSGLQYRYECFCNDIKPSNSLLVGESDCLYPCSGDISQICGGGWRYSVYWNGIQNPSRNMDNYFGCFKERNAPNQLLPLDVIKLETSLTPQLCIEHCFRKGFAYAGAQISSVVFGTQMKSQCHCGDYRPPAEAKTDDSQCSSICPGDKTKKCGGDWRLSIYRTGVRRYNQTYAEANYLGCFPYNRGTLSHYKVDLDNNSPQRCMGVCKGGGYPFAGVKNGNECYCGYKTPPSSSALEDQNCSSICSGDKSAICGANNTWSIYSIQSPDVTDERDRGSNLCQRSKTENDGKQSCSGQNVFEDNFNEISSDKWQHSVKMSVYPENNFAYFTSDRKNSFIKDGVLHIHPTVLPNENVTSGRRELFGCTGNVGSQECLQDAFSYNILPPIASAEISTKKTFSFRYGIVEIRAKLPSGDWLIPEIWLEPKSDFYGAGLLSGKIKIAFARGNGDLLTSDGRDISIKYLDTGVMVGHDDYATGRYVTASKSEGWHKDFHNYTLIWTPDNINLEVDGVPLTSIMPSNTKRMCSLFEQQEQCSGVWAKGTKIAPFDKEFYLTLGLTAGGMREFPDGCRSRGYIKPWKNNEVKAKLKFWLDKANWYSSWRSDQTDLKIDYVRVRAL